MSPYFSAAQSSSSTPGLTDRWLKADLHVHTYHSGYNADLPFLRSRDCYSAADAVYHTAKARGMDLVAITDHDSIDGCLEFLNRHPDARDFIIGEEITCWMPDVPIEVHFGAYGMTEQAHADVQPLRRNAFEVAAYLRESGIFFSLNHLFHFYRGQIPLERYLALLDHVPALETRNGAMLAAHNRLIEEIRDRHATLVTRHGLRAGEASTRRLASVAGSDAHTLRRVGRTWTSAPGRTREEFLASVAAGRGVAGGEQGGTLPLAADIYGVIVDYWLSLVGLRRHEGLSMPRRALGLAFSVVSAPFEFIPLVVAAVQKSGEASRVAALANALAIEPEPAPPPARLPGEPGEAPGVGISG